MTSDDNGLGLKIEGDLGGLQIEEISDDDTDHSTNQTDSSTMSLSQIPNGLVQPSTTPVFGSVAVTNSDNVQFGNNTYFNGPVIIKQIIQKTGVENGSYIRTDDEYPDTTSTINNPETKLEKSLKCKIQNWQLITFFSVSAIVLGGTCALMLSYNKGNQDTKNVGSISTDSETDVSGPFMLVKDYLDTSLTSLLILGIWVVFIPFILLTYIIILANIWKITTNFCDCMIRKHIKIKSTKDENLLISREHLRMVSREDWLAQPVEKPLDPIRQPIPWVIVTHTATEGCTTQSQCILRVRLIQLFHVESKGWFDIGYNFLVGGDGSVYIGRGWDNMGSHTKGYNKYSLGVAVIGTFNKEKPPKRQMDALQKLLELGVKLGKLKKDYTLFAHKHFMSTLSPGETVYDIIKTWPHFVKNATNIDALLPDY